LELCPRPHCGNLQRSAAPQTHSCIRSREERAEWTLDKDKYWQKKIEEREEVDFAPSCSGVFRISVRRERGAVGVEDGWVW